MSKEVDNRVVEMRFDNTDFEKNCDRTLKSLDKLDNALKFKDAQKGFNELEKSSDRVNFGGLSGSIDSVSVKLNTMQAVAIGVLTNIANKAVDSAAVFAKSLSLDQIFAGWSKYEEKTSAVQMIVNQGYDLQEVENQMEKLNWFTDETSYNFTDMANNIGKFTAQGQDLERSTTAMEGISTWAALSGAGIMGASRAMYNLSQALGMGSVRVQDWMSIENANMATAEFKNTVIETAKELGKLSEDTTVTASNFRTTLSTNWFDSDVLMATLEKYGSFTDKLNEATEATGLTATEMLRYIEKYKTGSADLSAITGENTSVIVQYVKELGDSEYELGYKAFKAAQEAKTFTEAIIATKDAVSTAWLNVFQTIFGGYDEARHLWTNLANELYDVFAEPVNGINEVLSSAFTSSWDTLLEKVHELTSIDLDDFKTTLQEVGIKNHRITQSMIDDAGSLYDSFKYGWATSDVFTTAIDKYISKVEGMSEAELEAAGYTKDYVEELKSFREQIVSSDTELNGLIKTLGKASARDNFIDAFWNIFHAITGVIQAIKEGFREIFPPKTAEDIVNISEKVKELTERLNLFNEDGETLNETGQKLKQTFQGVFAVFGIAKDILDKVFQILSPIWGATDGLGDSVLTLTAKIGVWLTSLRDWIRDSETLNKVVGWLTTAVQFMVEVIQMVWDKLKVVFDWLNEHVFSKVVSWIDEFIGKFKKDGDETVSVVEKIEAALDSIITVIGGAILAIGDFFKKIWGWLTQLWTWIKSWGIWEDLKNFFANLKTSLSELWDVLRSGAEDGSLMAWLVTLASTGFAYKITKGVKDIMDAVTSFANRLADIGMSFSKFLDSITGSFEKMQKNIKYKIVRNIAISVLLLAAAVALLANTFSENSNAAFAGLGAVVGLTLMLVAILKVIEKMDIDMDKIKKQINAMIPLAAAIFVAALAFKILSTIDADGLWHAVIAMAAISVALIAAAKFLDKLSSSGGSIVKAASGLLIFSVAFVILAGAAKIFATMSWEELAKAGTAIGAISIILVGSAELLSRVNGGNVVKAASGLLIFSVAFAILGGAAKIFATMDWEELGKAGTAIAAISIILVGSAELLSRINGAEVVKSASGLLILSVAITILAAVAKIFATMEWGDMAKAAAGIGGLSLILVAVAELLARVNGTEIIKSSVGLLIFTKVILKLVGIAAILGALPIDMLNQGLKYLGIMGAGIAAFAYIMSNLDGVTMLETAGSMAILSAAILTMSLALIMLSSIDPKSALIGAGIILGLMAAFGAIGALIGPSVGYLIAFSEALLFFGVAMAAIGIGLLTTAAAFELFFNTFVKVADYIISKPLTFVTAIKIILDGIKELVVQFIKNIISGWKEIVVFASEAFHEMKEPLKQFIVDFFEVLRTLVPQIITLIKETIINICIAIVEMSPFIKDAIVQVIGDGIRGLLELLPLVADFIIQFTLEACRVLRETSSTVIDTVTEILGKLIEQALTLMPQLTELLIALTNSLCETLLTTAPKINETVTTLILGLLTEISENIEQVVELGIQIAINLINGIADKIGDVVQAGVNLVLNLIQGIADALNDDDNQERFRKAFVDLIVGVIKTVFTSFKIIGDIGKKAWEFMKSVWRDHIKPKFEEIKSKVKEIGHNIIEGIKEGIHDKIESLKAKCKEVTDAITGKIKDLLNIHSPSKVMAEIGKYTIMGMAQGIDKNASKAVNSMENLGNSMIDTTSTIAYKIAQALDQDMDISPTITPIMDLSQIQNGVGSINSMIGGTRGINGTISIASRATNGFNATMGAKNAEAIRIAETTGSSKAFNNTFNITGNNPKEIANEVSRIIAKQVERKNDQWA
ncbi:MAG: hypothetical protein KBT06_05560 [Prevotellaceae bacterium]|nr:hypothetical protein [Candidatus Colivivens equi]